MTRATPKIKKAWRAIVESAFEDKAFEEELAQSMWYRMEALNMSDGTSHDYDRWLSLPQKERDHWISVARMANQKIGDHWKTMANEWLTRWWHDHGEIGDIPSAQERAAGALPTSP